MRRSVHRIPLAIAGQVVMLFGFGGLLYALTVLRLLGRLGEAGLCRWGGALVAASSITVAVAGSWWWALPACFASGVGFYMLYNTPQINATQMSPERRGAAAYFIGQSAGITLQGVLILGVSTSGAILLGALGW